MENQLKIVHDYYLSQGGYLVNIVEFGDYIYKWLFLIGKHFSELYSFVVQQLK